MGCFRPQPQVADNTGTAFGLAVNLRHDRQQRMCGIFPLQPDLRALGVMADSGQRLIQLMRKTGGHLPEHTQLLGFFQILLLAL